MENIAYICKLLFATYNIPIYFIDRSGNLVFEYFSDHKENPYYSSTKEVLGQLNHKNYPFPIISSTSKLENFFSISVPNGNILSGPVLYSRLALETINGLINDLDLKNKDEVHAYYQSLPVLSHLNFINMSMVLYYMLFQKPLDVVEITQQNILLEKEKAEMEHPDATIAERRQNIRVHQDPMAEKRIFDCIRYGKKDELIHYIRALPETGELGVLSKKSHLRSEKNLAIAAITLATRSAVEGGLYPEVAYTLSDLFIQHLEEQNDVSSVTRLVESAMLEFAERVEKSMTDKYSKPISSCQNYIFTHIYEDITLPRLAEAAAMTPSYLSALFKKEAGITITEYIQRKKVDEAKNLITYTSHSLTEISSLLNFHDQSYFTKVFKKFAGVTPKQFKNGLEQ